jgi:hypothetical protein
MAWANGGHPGLAAGVTPILDRRSRSRRQSSLPSKNGSLGPVSRAHFPGAGKFIGVPCVCVYEKSGSLGTHSSIGR